MKSIILILLICTIINSTTTKTKEQPTTKPSVKPQSSTKPSVKPQSSTKPSVKPQSSTSSTHRNEIPRPSHKIDCDKGPKSKEIKLLAIILAKDSEQVESIIKTPDQIDPVVAGKKITAFLFDSSNRLIPVRAVNLKATMDILESDSLILCEDLKKFLLRIE